MIGFFDSGSGGLTVMEGCRKLMPGASFVYLGDHANAPYGHRDSQTIVDLTKAGVDALFRQGCTLVLLACNTAAAIALRSLQQEWLPKAWPGRNILGVLVPMVEAVSGVPWANEHPSAQSAEDERTIVLFATRKTVDSGAYAEELAKRAPNQTLVQKACPGLVDAIEGGAGQLPLAGLVKGYVDEVLADLGGANLDAAVLGCTHFPMVEHLFRESLGAGVLLYSQPGVVAQSLVRYLATHSEYQIGQDGAVRLLSTSTQKDLLGWDAVQPQEKITFEQIRV